MIIFGTRGVTSTRERGRFHCPSCLGEKPYAHKGVRRFFTLYFIPVIPLNQLGEYVECGSCKGTYRTEVLDLDPASQQRDFEAEFATAVRRVMAIMALADGTVDDEEIVAMAKVAADLTGAAVADAAMRAEVEAARREARPLADYLESTAPLLNERGKEQVLRAAIAVAAADGHVDASERDLLAEVGRELDMAPAHFKGVLQETGIL